MERREDAGEAGTGEPSDNFYIITERVSPLQKQLLEHRILMANTPADPQDPEGIVRAFRRLRLLEQLVEQEKARNPNYAVSRLHEPEEEYQFYSCFISYSHKDEEFARRLHSRLQDAGLRVWYAPKEMKGGRKLHQQIEDGIRAYDKLLLVLSEQSLASEWVATEIRKARKAERNEGRQKLFPIRLMPFDPHVKEWECFDADSGKDLGVELREYFIPDFEHWQDHDAFEEGVARLLKDL